MSPLTILLAILSSLTLTLTSPLPSSTSTTTSTSPSPSTCIAQSWSIIGFSTYTAPPGPLAPGTPAVFASSRISFRFRDPNTGTETSCFRALEAGKGGSVAEKHRYFECEDKSVKYLFDGELLTVREKLKCGSKTVTAQGSILGNVNCQDRYGGQLCQTDISEVPVTPEIRK